MMANDYLFLRGLREGVTKENQESKTGNSSLTPFILNWMISWLELTVGQGSVNVLCNTVSKRCSCFYLDNAETFNMPSGREGCGVVRVGYYTFLGKICASSTCEAEWRPGHSPASWEAVFSHTVHDKVTVSSDMSLGSPYICLDALKKWIRMLSPVQMCDLKNISKLVCLPGVQ